MKLIRKTLRSSDGSEFWEAKLDADSGLVRGYIDTFVGYEIASVNREANGVYAFWILENQNRIPLRLPITLKFGLDDFQLEKNMKHVKTIQSGSDGYHFYTHIFLTTN